tara:strand:+ start:489 stop:704 length:216 start_codon:yes stop_codon:yes gene_type:complete
MPNTRLSQKQNIYTNHKYYTMSILTIILNILLPPLGVALAKGAGKDLLINILLTLLGWLPGVIHAFYVTGK